MKRFACPECRAEVHFDNSTCVACRTPLAYDSAAARFVALNGPAACANRDLAACNWLAQPGARFCAACRHNRTVPDTAQGANKANWRAIEQAKRYLFYSLLRWDLPRPTRQDRPDGLAFDFLADTGASRVMTGHANGLITLNIAEGDDAEREARRTAMGEPYRTLIGHMRHEIGHFYWQILVRDGGPLDRCRAVFGDDRADYAAALRRHYTRGAPAGWSKRFISAYATAHPWEDFAETWAHYIHIVDASETAHAFGMALRDLSGQTTEMTTNPYLKTDLSDTLADWVPLTVAMNALNRSIGQPDFYPFVLSGAVKAKLAFIHDLIHTPR